MQFQLKNFIKIPALLFKQVLFQNIKRALEEVGGIFTYAIFHKMENKGKIRNACQRKVLEIEIPGSYQLISG